MLSRGLSAIAEFLEAQKQQQHPVVSTVVCQSRCVCNLCGLTDHVPWGVSMIVCETDENVLVSSLPQRAPYATASLFIRYLLPSVCLSYTLVGCIQTSNHVVKLHCLSFTILLPTLMQKLLGSHVYYQPWLKPVGGYYFGARQMWVCPFVGISAKMIWFTLA